MDGLREIASLEESRAARSGRGFSLVRIAPLGWRALESDLRELERLIGAQVRKTDSVKLLPTRELAVVLVEAVDLAAQAPLARLREALQRHPAVGVQWRMGWCSVGPGQRATWQEAWRWAGTLLVADAAQPAAA